MPVRSLRCLRTLVVVFCFLMQRGSLEAVPVSPPVERELVDASGRSIRARIIDITPSAVEIVRLPDEARFTFPLASLSAKDRADMIGLFDQQTRPVATREPRSDTELIKAVRKDFRRYDRAERRLLPVSTSWPGDWKFLIVCSSPSHYNSERTRDLPLLWINFDMRPDEFDRAITQLRPMHLAVSSEAQKRGEKLAESISRNHTAGHNWNDRVNPLAGDELRQRLRTALPPYWAEPPLDGITRSILHPYSIGTIAHLIHLDGRIARYRGEEISGSVEAVCEVLLTKTADIE